MRGQRFEIRDSLTLGREATCGLVVEDPKVSRHHGTLVVRDNKLFYKDHQSTNGSFLNGTRISETELRQGDLLKVGRCEFSLLEESDFRTINFVRADSQVTSSLNTSLVRPDALAEKFNQIFDYYKDHQPETSEAERYELVRTQRLLNGLKTIYAISQSMTKLAPLAELLEQIGTDVFELFAGAENIVILLKEEDTGKILPSYARARDGDETPTMSISQTVLERAVDERCTLIANDAGSDSRLQGSESIMGFSVKSVMCAPLVSGDEVLGALYLDNRLENVTYDDLDAELVTAFANQCAIAVDNALLNDSLQEHYHQTLQALVNAIEAKDPYTKGHTARVSMYSVGIAAAYGLDEKRIHRIKCAADLHDIGKIGIQEKIINKAGSLTDTEYSSIKSHVEMGEKILKPVMHLRDVLPFIRGHHERWDGSGYPDGKKEEENPLEARILACADAFDAMTSQRSYNKPLSFEQALDVVKKGAGTQFDPKVVEALEKYVRDSLLGEKAFSPAFTTDRA